MSSTRGDDAQHVFAHVPEIADKYDGFERLSEGGQGMIYRARHKFLDEVRVIKTIHSSTEFEDAKERFMREARIAAKLRHPNIATVHDFIVGPTQDAFLIMEYIDGTNLWELYRRKQRIKLAQVALLAHQVLDALDYLHKQNFVHRDIALDNVMMTQDARGQVVFKLIDLGIAKSLDSNDYKTSTGVALGKVLYISPEALKYGSGSSEVDTRSDLYSFGVMLYQLLTGELPIQGTDQTSLIAGHLYQPPRDFQDTDPNGRLSEPLREVLLRSIEKEPGDRFQTAPELSRTLRHVLPPPDDLRFDATSLIDPNDPTNINMPTRVQPSAARTAPAGAFKPPARGQTTSAEESAPGRRKVPLLAAAAAILVGALVLGVWASGLLSGTSASSDRMTTSAPFGSGPERGLSALDYGSFKALVIGIDDYDEMQDLKTAVRDARRVAGILEEHYGFDVTLVEDASRSDLLSAIEDLSHTLTSRDSLLVYYAGHGREEGMEQYWLPRDAEEGSNSNWLLTDSEIAANLDDQSMRHLLIVADSCFAGAVGSLAPGEQPLEEVLRRQSRLVMASGNQTYIADNSGNGHSVFATALIDALENNQRVLTAAELFQGLQEVVPKLAGRQQVDQIPTFAPLPNSNDEGGMFVFVPRETKAGA